MPKAARLILLWLRKSALATPSLLLASVASCQLDIATSVCACRTGLLSHSTLRRFEFEGVQLALRITEAVLVLISVLRWTCKFEEFSKVSVASALSVYSRGTFVLLSGNRMEMHHDESFIIDHRLGGSFEFFWADVCFYLFSILGIILRREPHGLHGSLLSFLVTKGYIGRLSDFFLASNLFSFSAKLITLPANIV